MNILYKNIPLYFIKEIENYPSKLASKSQLNSVIKFGIQIKSNALSKFCSNLVVCDKIVKISKGDTCNIENIK